VIFEADSVLFMIHLLCVAPHGVDGLGHQVDKLWLALGWVATGAGASSSRSSLICLGVGIGMALLRTRCKGHRMRLEQCGQCAPCGQAQFDLVALPRAVVEARFALQDSAPGVLCYKPKRCLRPSMAAPAYLLIGACLIDAL